MEIEVRLNDPVTLRLNRPPVLVLQKIPYALRPLPHQPSQFFVKRIARMTPRWLVFTGCVEVARRWRREYAVMKTEPAGAEVSSPENSNS